VFQIGIVFGNGGRGGAIYIHIYYVGNCGGVTNEHLWICY